MIYCHVERVALKSLQDKIVKEFSVKLESEALEAMRW